VTTPSQVFGFQTDEKDVLTILRTLFYRNRSVQNLMSEHHFHALGIVYRSLESSTEYGVLLLC
jgi:hypothetical protein